MDRTISEQFTVGGTDLYIHKYLGPDTSPSVDHTQPEYANESPLNIQDLLFLENRDRKYDTNIYRLRGHYNVQNLDFDLSQFGLFLNNDIIFITIHYNDMIDLIGRKLMVGDVLELPHLLDYNPLDEKIPTALKRFMQITDSNYASEGFSQTWYPHLWRIKCEPLVDSQEFSQILSAPVEQDNYLGPWESNKVYPLGYTITYGDKIYKTLQEVPIGTNPPDPAYFELVTDGSLSDILATYNKNIKINDAALKEAQRQLPKSGYDKSKLYVVPTYGEFSTNNTLSGKYNQPAPPINLITNTGAGPILSARVVLVSNPNYAVASPAVRIPKALVQDMWSMTADMSFENISAFSVVNIETATIAPTTTDSGSGPVSGNRVLSVLPMGQIVGPYGTADNTYATGDQDPTAAGFTGTEPYGPNTMDYRADADPAYQFIARSSPRSFGYTTGYLDGTGEAPNGFPTGAGIAFPQNPKVGDYFLRIDYFPQLLYRWDGQLWVRISSNVRTETGFATTDQTQTTSFINNTNQTLLTDGTSVPQSQPLSGILQLAPDTLPPVI